MRDEAKTWWLVCGPDVASSYFFFFFFFFFFEKIPVALESQTLIWVLLVVTITLNKKIKKKKKKRKNRFSHFQQKVAQDISRLNFQLYITFVLDY